jgi:hypothetical protein
MARPYWRPLNVAASGGGGGGQLRRGISGGGGSAASSLLPPSSSKTGAFRHLLQEEFFKSLPVLFTAVRGPLPSCPPDRLLPFPLSQVSTEHANPSPFRSVFVADFCFSTTAFSAMFVHDVENAAPAPLSLRVPSR